MKNSVFLPVLLLLVYSINICSQWVQTSNGMYDLRTYSLAANQTKIFAGTQEALSVSTNNGLSWSWVNFNGQSEPVHSLFVFDETVFAGVQGYGVTVSANNGGYWTFHHPLGNRHIYSLNYTADGKLFASASADGGGTQGIYLSTDNGYSFTPTGLLNKTVLSLTSNNSGVFAGTQDEGIYVTTNNGATWSQTALNNQTVKSLISNNGFLFAGTSTSGVFISSNNGSSWIQSSLNNQEILSLAVMGNNIFAGTSSSSNFYVSTNNGVSWTLKNEGLGNNVVNALCVINGFIFAGTTTNGVYRRSLDELTAIQPVSNNIPNEYSLSQNYPNPFNPTTKIKFALPPLNLPLTGGDREGVLFKIYDLLGKDIVTLVNQQLTPGTYEVEWNASNYPSGIYFYTLSVGEFSETKKAILLK